MYSIIINFKTQINISLCMHICLQTLSEQGERSQQSSHIGYVGGVFNFLGSVSPEQNFEAMDRPVLQLRYCRPVLQLIAAQFFLASKRRYILEA